MQWLQSLDAALFHFGNSTLANPFFDWLMPLLSGKGVPWLAAAIIGVVWILVGGSTRLRICALFAVLVVALGDPLIVGTVKHAVRRPRPFVTQPDARHFGKIGDGYIPPMKNGELPANANRASMPSAHAANWFALAVTLLVFYRRSAWFMFPMAAAVAYSRVYNGVHYPGDVLVGGILGAGYAVAFMVIWQFLWKTIGRKLFPAWHARLPNLLNPEPKPQNQAPNAKSEIGNRKSEMEWLRLGYLLIAAAFVARCIYLSSGLIGLSGDEAYQWLWSKHLALSYFSKPPGIAYIQWAGTALFGDTNLGVRFFSPVFAAILGFMVLRFLAREIGARNAFLLLLLVTFATPLLVAGSILMTIDPPLVLCWMWAVLAGWRAVQPDGKTRDWLIVGVAMGLGFLCKYSMLFLPVCLGIYFALQPSARPHLRKPGPWLALGLLLLSTLPVIIWNGQHGWITMHHVANNAGIGENRQWHPTLKYFVEFLGAEAGLLNPVFFIATLWACFAFWKIRRQRPILLFLFCMGGPVFFGYWLYAFHSRILPNWIAPAVPPLFCLMAIYWAGRRVNFKPWFATGMILGLVASVLMYDSGLLGKFIQKLPGDVDPSHRVRGWREAAHLVEAERAKFDTNAFIIAENYSTTGLYSFYSPAARAAAISGKPLVYCIHSDHPANQFYFWNEYNYEAHRRGQNAIFVRQLQPYDLADGWFWKWLKGKRVDYAQIPPPRPVDRRIANEFESVTNLGIFDVKIKDGRVFQRLQMFGCYDLK